jgi:SAM-dependent methyltransferase
MSSNNGKMTLKVVAQKMRNVMRGILQNYGAHRVKRYLWNGEYLEGRWDFIDKTPGDCVYPFIEKYAAKGSILDLGCGSGNTANELGSDAYSYYAGIDISDVAIDKAIRKTRQTGRSALAHYFQSDISHYVPARQFDLILFRESIYYLPGFKINAVLSRYSSYLNGGGVFVVRLIGWKAKHKPILDLIEKRFDVVEKCFLEQPSVAVIVFRPRVCHQSLVAEATQRLFVTCLAANELTELVACAF